MTQNDKSMLKNIIITLCVINLIVGEESERKTRVHRTNKQRTQSE